MVNQNYSMLDALSLKELYVVQIELIEALEQYRKKFSESCTPESKLEDLSFDFHNLNDKTQNFIKMSLRRIAELENIIEQVDEFKWKN